MGMPFGGFTHVSSRSANSLAEFKMRQNISVFAAISCLLLSVSSILYLVTFASPYWFVLKAGKTYVRSGLWTSCAEVVQGINNQTTLQCSDTAKFMPTSWNTNWVPAMQAMFTLGLISMLAAAVCSYVYLFVPKMEKTTGMAYIATCLSFASFGFSLVGYVTYGVKDNSDYDLRDLTLSWCFGVNITASVIGMAATVLLFFEFARMLDIRLQQKNRNQRRRQAVQGMQPIPINRDGSAASLRRRADNIERNRRSSDDRGYQNGSASTETASANPSRDGVLPGYSEYGQGGGSRDTSPAEAPADITNQSTGPFSSGQTDVKAGRRLSPLPVRRNGMPPNMSLFQTSATYSN